MNPRRAIQKPVWRRLYAILGAIGALWIIAIRATPSAAGDRWLDLVFLTLLFGVMLLWVQANQVAFVQSDQITLQWRSRVVRVIMSPPPEALPRNVGNDSVSKNGQPLHHTEGYMVCLVISDRR